MEFNYIIMLLCIAFAIFLGYKEITRFDLSKLIWRLLANILMLAFFALLIIPIQYTLTKKEPAHVLNLLTEGTSLDTVEAIKGKRFALDSTLFPNRKKLKINYLADLNYYLAKNPDVKKINIYGYGLDENELKSLKNHRILFHPSLFPSGILSANWQKKLRYTENLKVQGIYHNSTRDIVRLKLQGLGATLDSAEVKPNSNLKFSFVNQPKQIGKAVFSIIALKGNDTLSVDPVPFEVENKKPTSVLILASFPDFEYKFLKKWLYENQYGVALRSQISKGKYSTDFLNRKAVNVNQLNQALLKTMDLVIIDEDELNAIPSSDRSAIYAAVNNGMGLIIRVTNPKPKTNGQNFNQYELANLVEKPLILKSSDHFNFSNLILNQTLFLKATRNEQPLILDDSRKILVNSKLSGMGKILISTFSSTYLWELAGKKADYSKFWSLIFDKSLRKELTSQSFQLLPQFATVNEKSRLIVSLANNKAPKISIDSIPISPRQNMEIPFEWDGFFWAKKAGWHNLSVNGKTDEVYFYKKTDWKNAKNFANIKQTASFADNQSINEAKDNEIQITVKEAISNWWFLIGFLLSITFLWYEQRFLEKK